MSMYRDALLCIYMDAHKRWHTVRYCAHMSYLLCDTVQYV
jgi:hypothetical protein